MTAFTPLLVDGDAHQMGLDQVTGGDAPLLHRTLHLGDGRFDHVEGLRAILRCRSRGEQPGIKAATSTTAGRIFIMITSLPFGTGRSDLDSRWGDRPRGGGVAMAYWQRPSRVPTLSCAPL